MRQSLPSLPDSPWTKERRWADAHRWQKETPAAAGPAPRIAASNRQIWTQKASVVTDIVAKYLERKCLLPIWAGVQTGLHFEAFYVLWISLAKR